MAEYEARALRLQLVAAGAQLAQLGLILPGEGNLSVRSDSEYCLLTKRGVDKGRLAAPQLLQVPIAKHDATHEESSESPMHCDIYCRVPKVRAVIHAHPRAVQELAVGERVPDCSLLLEAAQLLPGVGWVRAAEPGSRELAHSVSGELLQWPACVLFGHGAVTVGESLRTALRRMLLLERLAVLTLGALAS